MNAEISRDVILDLLPAYLSGEASSDTRGLIETYMKQDPEFAAAVKEESKALFSQSATPAMKPDRELESLHRTKRMLRRRGWHLGLAIFFTLLSITFHIGPEGVQWTWHEAPLAAVVTTLLALLFWVTYAHGKHHLKPSGV